MTISSNRITILALGSRGDVQPYVALGLGLQRAGHGVTILASDEFESFVVDYGLKFFPLGVRLRETVSESDIARSILKSGRGLVEGISSLIRQLQPIIKTMLANTWAACEDADAIILSTVGFQAFHAAEKRGVPCFWALTMPVFSRTRFLRDPLLPRLLWPGLNSLSHLLSRSAWHGITASSFNAWRRELLDLPPVSPFGWPYTQLQGRPVPMLYGYSPLVVPRPPDWSDPVSVTGYWCLDRPAGWQPPADLLAFLEAGPPPIYVGFGSLAFGDPGETTRIVLEALRRSGQRGVLLSGWARMGDTEMKNVPADDVFVIDSVPHDWLFPRMAAVVHHGGAGTTGAGLRSGVPSILVPFAADQFFWGERVQALGVGPLPIPRKALTVEKLAYALRIAATHEPLRRRAAALGEKLRAEDGVGNAVKIIEHYLRSGVDNH